MRINHNPSFKRRKKKIFVDVLLTFIYEIQKIIFLILFYDHLYHLLFDFNPSHHASSVMAMLNRKKEVLNDVLLEVSLYLNK